MASSSKTGNSIDVVLAVGFLSKWKALSLHGSLLDLSLLDKGNAKRRNNLVTSEIDEPYLSQNGMEDGASHCGGGYVMR